MAECRECGAEIPENSSACPSCGAPVAVAATKSGEIGADASESDAGVSAGVSSAAVNEASGDANSVGANESQARAVERKGGLSPAMKKALIAASVAIAASVGLIFWQMKVGGGRAINLSAEDMAILAETQPPQYRMLLASDEAERKEFSKDIREQLALAEEARRAGIASKPEVRAQLGFLRAFVLAQSYAQKQREAGVRDSDFLPQNEVEAYLKEPGTDKKFDDVISSLREMQLIPPGELSEEDSKIVKNQLGRVMLAARKAEAAGIERERKVQLQLQMQEANVLSKAYTDENAKRFAASDEEVNAYVQGARSQAEQVLSRARAGEDFAKLAKEFSTEPSAGQTGGDIGWISRNMVVKPFEEVAFSLKEGEISEVVETDFGYHIIKLEERRTSQTPEGQTEEQVRVRHILFMTIPQQLKMVLAEKKRSQFLAGLVSRNRIRVAEDFKVNPPQSAPLGDF